MPALEHVTIKLHVDTTEFDAAMDRIDRSKASLYRPVRLWDWLGSLVSAGVLGFVIGLNV